MFKAKNKNKMRNDNQLYEIEIREIKRRKGAKSTRKVLAKIEMSGVTMVPYLTSKDFTLCLHLLHLNFIIVNFELIFRSGFPSIQQLCQ